MIGPFLAPVRCHFFSGVVCLLAGFVCSAALGQSGELDPLDWPNWRGPQQNNTSLETGLVDSWDPEGGEGSNLLWKNKELAGRSTPIVLRGKLYTIVRDQAGTANEGEMVVCADAATGEIVWKHRFNVYLSDVPDTRVGWSSCVGDPETGRIYAQGVAGYFCCLEGDTGKLVWDRSLHEEFGLISTYGGRTNFPVIYEDTVIANAVVVGWGDTPQWDLLARPAHRFMGFDKATGELRWLKGTSISPPDTTYSTPVVTRLAGTPALVFGSSDGQVWALQAGTGLPIWNYPLSRRGLNTSPTVGPDGTVYMSHGEENLVGITMGAVVAIDGNMKGDLTDKELWKEFEVLAGKTAPILIDDRLYVTTDSGKLMIYDAETGKFIRRVALGTSQRSTPLYADGKLYLCTNEGRWYILEPNDSGAKIIHRLRLSGESSDGSPIVSHGRIYVPTDEYLYCIGKADAEPTAAEAPKQAEPPAPDTNATLVQVSPWDTVLAPGDEQPYQARLFNKRGEFIREASGGDVQFTVTGPGQITSDGLYTAPEQSNHECALVTCKVGDLQGTARIRVIPSLPWKFDFNDGEDVPLTWIGGRVRYELRDVDGERFMAKRTILPTPKNPRNKLGTRSQMWMGPVDLTNYTVQADVQLQKGVGSESLAETLEDTPDAPPDASPSAVKVADMGLINSRYAFTISGASKEIRLYSWGVSDHRTQAKESYPVEPSVWYTLKIRVEPKGDTALVQGKIWKRGEAEPSDWSIEFTDHAPNLQGSPGLFGNSQQAEFFVDNLTVEPN